MLDELYDLQQENKRLREQNAKLRASLEKYSDLGAEGANLRSGRAEHLTLAAAEHHADWLRPLNATVVGKLLIVVVDELRRLRGQTR